MTPEPPASPPPPVFPPPSEPRRDGPERAGILPVLIVLLAVSLLASVTLAVRLADATSRVERERDRAASLQAQLDAARASATPSPDASGATFGDPVIARIARAVEQLRGLRFDKAVKTEVLTPEQLRARIEQSYGKDQPRTEVDATDKVLTALGLLAPDDDLYRILKDVSTEQIAGYYDDDDKELVVAGNPERMSPYDRMLTAHELTHALTDQRFGLSGLGKLQDERKDDEATAYLSLVEGDATLMMVLYNQQVLTREEQRDVERQADGESSPELEAAPAVVRTSLIFPYDEGRRFVAALYQRGGTAEIDRAYRDPPASTEQIMHPARYFNRDQPQVVTMPDVRAALGERWRSVDAGGMGELDIQILADQYLPEADARAAAEGWDGGRYVAVESDAGTLVAVSTVWDSADEAREAADALGDWLRPRFGGNGAPYRDGPSVVGWQSPRGSAEVVRSGDRVVLVIGPDKESVRTARSAFPGMG